MKAHNIYIDFLKELQVPYTSEWSTERFDSMSFKSLFGMQQLLKEYGVPSEGFSLPDKSKFSSLPVPFIAATKSGLVIVTAIDSPDVKYLSQGVSESIPFAYFEKAATGEVFLAFPTADSREPEYRAHRFNESVKRLRDYGLIVGAFLLFLYLFITNRIYAEWSQILIMALDMAGLYFSFLLVQKTLNIKNRAADRVCKVLQEGGCDSVLKTGASKLFGVFSWSEVGLTYFSVSLLTLLIFPQFTSYLALCNAICLPFTFWSIWYQKFRAKAWCTLCVSVQCLLWLLFLCYLGGGWYRGILPVRIEFFVLGLTYVTVMLAFNRTMSKIEQGKDE